MILNNNLDGTYVSVKEKSNIKENKLAIFDLKWTIIKPKDGKDSFENSNDWIYLRNSVPIILKSYNNTHQIIFLCDSDKDITIDLIENVVKDLKLDVVILLSLNSKYNKPNEELFKSVFKNIEDINKDESFIVSEVGGSKNWTNVNYDLSKKLNIKFLKTENFFPFNKIKVIKTNFENNNSKEVVIMIGSPGSGKSSIAKNNLSNYKLICGDTFRNTKSMINEANKFKNESIIFDGTNGTKKRRSMYISYAKTINAEVKFIWVNTSIEDSIENIKKRKFEGGHYVPKKVLYDYHKNFEVPTEDECSKIIKIN